MTDIKTYQIRGYGSPAVTTTETRREGDEEVTVKTVITRSPIQKVRGVVVPLDDDGGFRRDNCGDSCLVTSSDQNFLRNLKSVAFRNLSLGKDNRTYWIMSDGSELDEDRDEGPEDAEWWEADRVIGEVAE